MFAVPINQSGCNAGAGKQMARRGNGWGKRQGNGNNQLQHSAFCVVPICCFLFSGNWCNVLKISC